MAGLVTNVPRSARGRDSAAVITPVLLSLASLSSHPHQTRLSSVLGVCLPLSVNLRELVSGLWSASS